MSQTGIVLVHAQTTALIVGRGARNHNRLAAVQACATCQGDRDAHTLFQYEGFCRECLDRSRIVAGDDLGGES